MMQRIFGYGFVLIAGFFLLISCSNPLGGSNSSVTQSIPGSTTPVASTVAPANGSDFASASVQGVATANGRFILSGALSETTSSIQDVTSHGYILFSNIQGQFISNQEGL